MKATAHMICHTHWDREWYFTREQFRTKLVRLIDGLLEVIDTVPEYVSFMLDGQAIVLEDYLEIKPYNREKLMKALRSGKIICGPWYILPDELLISGESHIRNYITGSRIIDEFGSKMEYAYLPDSFGHPAQMPQIVSGLGMDTMIFWRGTSNEIKNTEFTWESPDGISKALCVHMPYGYGNCGNLSSDMEVTVPRIVNLAESLLKRTDTDVILLMNGSDHIVGQRNITKIVERLNQLCPQYDIKLSTMKQYIEQIKPKLDMLQNFTGELRSAERSMLLGGTLSSRMMLKQKNAIVQNTMERYLEPVLSGEKLLGGSEDVSGYSAYIWRKILENQPHDSICGCSIDEVHSEMLTRYQSLMQLENMLLSDAVKRIGSLTANSKALKQADPDKVEQKTDIKNPGSTQLMVFEPTQDRLPSYVETEILMDKVLVQEVNFAQSTINEYESSITHPELPRGINITDETGRNIPYVLLEKEKSYDTLYQDHTAPEIYKVNKLKVGLLLPGYDYGCHLFTVEKRDEEARKLVFEEEASPIENQYYKVTASNGAFDIYDKRNNRLHQGVGRLVDKGDAGDEYTFSWPEEDQTYTLRQENVKVTKEISGDLGESLIIDGSLFLPEGLEESRKRRSSRLVSVPVKIKISLYAGIDRIDFKTEIENTAKDHRLQVQFPSGIRTDYSESSDVFNITKRNISVTVPEKWAEYPQTTHPTHGFINVEDGSYGLSAATCGLAEFEAEQLPEETAINVTLLRCVGWLSRTDLYTRKGNGGWTIETPDAQCLGRQTFEYSIAYHTGSFRDGNSYGLMEKSRLPVMIRQIKLHDKAQALNVLGWVSCLPKEIRLSALKVSEDGSGIILRVFNIGRGSRTVALTLPAIVKSAARVNLTENKPVAIPMNGQNISFDIKASEIVTLKLE